MPAESPLLQLLRAHGLTRAAARAAERHGRRLRGRTRRRGVEYALMLDAETGAVVGAELSGTERGVDIRPHLEVLPKGRRYVQVHTHPRSTAFPDVDAVLLVQHAGLDVMLVIGLDGTWYVLSKHPEDPPPATRQAAEQVYAAFWAEIGQLVPGFECQPRASSLPADEARKQLTHALWERVAGRHGLRYDRFQGDET